MIGVLVKRIFGDIGRMLFEEKGRDRMVLLHTKEAKSFKQTPEAREEAWNTFFPIALKRNHLCQPLDLGLVASNTMRQQISVIQALSLWYYITAALMYKE